MTVFIQARLSSKRFPKKMLQKINGYYLFEYVYKRCLHIANAEKVIILTSNDPTDDSLATLCDERNIPYFRGDLNNVLKRFIDASKNISSELICRVCGDSPFVDIQAIDKMYNLYYQQKHLDYIQLDTPINGFFSEIISKKSLQNLTKYTLSHDDYEHVTLYIRKHQKSFNIFSYSHNVTDKVTLNKTLTIDYPEDISIIRNIAKKYGNTLNFTSNDILKFLKAIS